MKADDALKTGRPFIKFHGRTTEQLNLTDRNVTFLADPGAQLTSESNGILLRIDGTSQVIIYDLEITGASGPNNPGISLQPGNAATLTLVRAKLTGNSGAGVSANGGTVALTNSAISNNGSGISANAAMVAITQSLISDSAGVGISTSGGVATVTQSTVSGSGGSGISSDGGTISVTRSVLFGNGGGGLSLGGSAFQIRDNFIYRNGNTINTSVGGIALNGNLSSSSTLEFNTIVDNQARVASTSVGGVLCDQIGFVASHNIIFRNTGGMTGDVQALGLCTYGDSLNMPGASNIDNSPGFAHPNATPFDYHLTPASPSAIVDAAGACTGVDFDGDMRPIGAACDLGADERKP